MLRATASSEGSEHTGVSSSLHIHRAFSFWILPLGREVSSEEATAKVACGPESKMATTLHLHTQGRDALRHGGMLRSPILVLPWTPEALQLQPVSKPR